MTSTRRPGSFVSHTATYAVGNIARRLVGFVMLPIYTRLLTPADYGVIGLLTFALALLEPLIGARLGRAVPKFYFDAPDALSRRAVIWSALGLTGAASVVSVILLILFRDGAADVLFGNRKYALALGLFAVTLFSHPIEHTGMAYLRLREQSKLFVGFSIAKLLLQLGLNLLLVVYWREGVVGVVLSSICASVLLGIGTTAYVAIHEAPAFDWKIARKMVQFCWPLWIAGLAGLYIGASGALYLRIFDSLSDVGRLEVGLKLAAAVSMLTSAPFFQHWEPMSFRYYKEGGCEHKFQAAFIAIAALMFTVGLGISIFSRPVIAVMASRSFSAAADVVPILTFGFILGALRRFFSFSFFATSHTKIHSLCEYATAVVVTVAYLSLVPAFGLMGAACARCLTALVSFIYVRILSRRYYDPGFNLVPIGVFTLIGVVAYTCSNVVFQSSNVAIDLLIKSLVMLTGATLIAVVGIRAIRATDVSSLGSLPWPLDRLERIQLGRQSGI